MSRKQRSIGTFGDMLRTLFVLAIAVGIVVALLPRHEHTAVRALDPNEYASDVSVYARSAGFTVLAPAPIPNGWSVTSLRTSRQPGAGQSGLHVGMVTAAVRYAALEESSGDPTSFIAAQAAGAQAEGTVAVGTADWQQLRDRKGVVSLARTAGGVTVVLTGGATLDELRELAASLAPVSV